MPRDVCCIGAYDVSTRYSAMTFRLIKTNGAENFTCHISVDRFTVELTVGLLQLDNSGPNYEMEHGLAIFLSAIFNIFMVTVMALVSIIIAVSQTVKCCCKRKHQQKVIKTYEGESHIILGSRLPNLRQKFLERC